MIEVIAVNFTENDELELTLAKSEGSEDSVFELVSQDVSILDNIEFDADQTDITVVIPLSDFNIDLTSVSFSDLQLDFISKGGESSSPVTSINLLNQQSLGDPSTTIPEFDTNTNQYVVVVPTDALGVSQAIQPEVARIDQGAQTTTIQTQQTPQAISVERVEGIESTRIESLSNIDVMKLQRSPQMEASGQEQSAQQNTAINQQITQALQNTNPLELSNRQLNRVNRLQGKLEGITGKIEGTTKEIELIQEVISTQDVAKKGQLAKLDRLNTRVEKLTQQSNEVIENITSVIGQGVDRTGKEILPQTQFISTMEMGDIGKGKGDYCDRIYF